MAAQLCASGSVHSGKAKPVQQHAQLALAGPRRVRTSATTASSVAALVLDIVETRNGTDLLRTGQSVKEKMNEHPSNWVYCGAEECDDRYGAAELDRIK